MLAEIARHRRGAALGGADEEEVRCGPAAVACRDGHGCSSGAHAKRGNRRAAAIDSSLRAGCPKARSEEHTSELQSLMRISYAVFCLKKKKTNITRSNDLKSSTHSHTTYLIKTSNKYHDRYHYDKHHQHK